MLVVLVMASSFELLTRRPGPIVFVSLPFHTPRLHPTDGTSASAPIFAGVISLLNAARIDAGKAPLGFLNPLMYSAAANVTGSFYDVTIGSNRCGAIGFTPQCCSHAYHAAPGWDAVTGLGSPNYAVLRAAALSL